MNEQEQRETTGGRAIAVPVYGASQEALEIAALDEARNFFGCSVRLEIVRDYRVQVNLRNEPERRYWARVTVREVTQP